MNNSIKRVVSIFLVLTFVFLITSCGMKIDVPTDNFSVMKDAQIIGDLKGQVAQEGTFIEICFSQPTTFDTVVIEEKNNQVHKFSIWLKDENGEYQSIYQQDRIGDYRYCEIGEHTTDSLKICINSSNENQFELKNIDVLNITNNKNIDFRVTSYLVCQWFYGNENIDVDRLNTLTDVILFGVARFNENGEIYLQDLDINGEIVSGDKILKEITQKIRVINPNIKIHCNALGPDGVDAENKEALHSQAFIDNGDKLASNIVNFISSYGFDGFFFDYEYPYQAKSIRDYSKFIVKLDEYMDGYILGSALANWNCSLSKSAIKALDRVEIMAYDDMWTFHDSHAEFASGGGVFAIEAFVKEGYDLSKCDLGLPFYGRTHGGDEAWPSYAQIAGDLENNPFKNTIPKSYLTNATDGSIITSFNGVQMIKDKTAYANDYGLGGVMVWHYTCDVSYDSDLSLFKAIQDALVSRN